MRRSASESVGPFSRRDLFARRRRQNTVLYLSRSFLSRKTLPAHVLVLGGGIIGCEFTCMLSQLKVRVTVVELLEDILSTFDADLRREHCVATWNGPCASGS